MNFPAHKLHWFSEICYDLSFAKRPRALHRKVLFEAHVNRGELRAMKPQEGKRLALWRLRQIARLRSVSPWDLLAVEVFARRRTIAQVLV